MSPAQYRVRSAVRFVFLTVTLGTALILAHVAAALPFLVVGL
jgi:hypothetical protein